MRAVGVPARRSGGCLLVRVRWLSPRPRPPWFLCRVGVAETGGRPSKRRGGNPGGRGPHVPGPGGRLVPGVLWGCVLPVRCGAARGGAGQSLVLYRRSRPHGRSRGPAWSFQGSPACIPAPCPLPPLAGCCPLRPASPRGPCCLLAKPSRGLGVLLHGKAGGSVGPLCIGVLRPAPGGGGGPPCPCDRGCGQRVGCPGGGDQKGRWPPVGTVSSWPAERRCCGLRCRRHRPWPWSPVPRTRGALRGPGRAWPLLGLGDGHRATRLPPPLPRDPGSPSPPQELPQPPGRPAGTLRRRL